jgi:hypothetical protein
MVHQRRMFIDTLKHKTMFMAMLDPAKAAELAKNYVEMSMPVEPQDLERMERDKERQSREIESMEPIPLSQVKLGTPMNQPYVQGA